MKYIPLASLAGLLAAGCANTDYPPLVYSQAQIVGLSVSGGASEAGVDATLGYRDANLAIIPVLNNNGEVVDATAGDGDIRDTFSTFGQFDVQATGNREAPEAQLGKFFATGFAARYLAENAVITSSEADGDDSDDGDE